jgi:hypothetical protein
VSRGLFVAAALATAVPTLLRAQSVTVFGGAGAAQSLSQPGLDRNAGPTVVGGIELARPQHSGIVGRLALRAEGGFTSQSFDENVVSGDVHTIHAALALRVALAGRGAGSGRLVPYAVAGGVWARPSTRFVLSEDPRSTPGARFEQVTHENVPGTMLGAGVAWLTQRAALRAEARWMSLLGTDGVTSTLPVIVTIAVPLHR